MKVDGYRYYWNYTYPNGVIAVDRLRAPVGQTTRLEVSAPDFEVIHSWWIPALGGKFDAIPGVTNETWFNAEAPGIYRGQCAEFCGIQHAAMRAEVEAMPREEFDPWLGTRRAAQEAGTSDLGEETYRGACAKCHGLAGEGEIGPSSRGNQLLDDPAALEQVIRNGRGRDATGRQGLGRPADGGPDRLPRGGAPRWRLTPARPSPLWQRGRVASWLVTTDHKRIGILYLATSGVLLPRGRDHGAADPHAARPGRTATSSSATATTSSSPCTARR